MLKIAHKKKNCLIWTDAVKVKVICQQTCLVSYFSWQSDNAHVIECIWQEFSFSFRFYAFHNYVIMLQLILKALMPSCNNKVLSLDQPTDQSLNFWAFSFAIGREKLRSYFNRFSNQFVMIFNFVLSSFLNLELKNYF